MKRKFSVILALLLALALILSACGGAAPAEEPAAPTEAPAAPTEAPPEPTEEPAPAEPTATLRIWADDTRTPILQALADDFLSEYNVALEVEDLGRVQDIRSQVIIAIPAGEGPDIYIGVHDWLGAVVESGLAAPIDLGDKRDQFTRSLTSDGQGE